MASSSEQAIKSFNLLNADSSIGYYEMIKVAPRPFNSLYFFTAIVLYTCMVLLFICFSYTLRSDLIAWLYLLVLTFDGFSQLTGQLFGKTKIAARISPGKTLAGLIGGVLATAFTAAVFEPLLCNEFSATKYWLLVLVIAGSAFAGDLMASAYKRKSGIKDYSRFIPGHGGVLDRFDSLLGAAAGSMLALFFF